MPSNTIHIEGIECEALSVAKTGIKPGEMYLARRNADWKLLTCAAYHAFDPITCAGHASLSTLENVSREIMCGLVFPVEPAYPFNDYECFRVVEQ